MSNQISGDDGPDDPSGDHSENYYRRNYLLLCLPVGFNPMPNVLLNSGKFHLSVFKQRERGDGEWREKGKEAGRVV